MFVGTHFRTGFGVRKGCWQQIFEARRPRGSASSEVIHRQGPIRPLGTPFPDSRPALIPAKAVLRASPNTQSQAQEQVSGAGKSAPNEYLSLCTTDCLRLPGSCPTNNPATRVQCLRMTSGLGIFNCIVTAEDDTPPTPPKKPVLT
jgi:hypothetical protein